MQGMRHQQCPLALRFTGCHNSFETFECFLVLPFCDSILKLSSVPAPSAKRIRGRALPPDRSRQRIGTSQLTPSPAKSRS